MWIKNSSRKLEWKRLFGRPSREWENNIKVEQKKGMRMWIRFIWFKIRSSGGLL